MFSLVISTQLTPGRQLSLSLKRNVALIVPGGYCSHVTLCPGMSRVWVPPVITITSLTPLPGREKMACPHDRRGLRWAKKRRGAHSGNLHKCSSHCKFVSSNLGTSVPRVFINGQPVPFLAPLVRSCLKVSSDRLRSSCRDISQQGPQASPVREIVTGDPMACSIPGRPRKRPSGTIACHQFWQLLSGLKHGRIESINQLAWYHAQTNTLTEWHRQFCSSETRFNRYAVNPKWHTLKFDKPKKQLCLVEYLSFLVHIIFNLIRWYCHSASRALDV